MEGTPMFSVNTNVGAMIALQNLNMTSSELQKTQNRINTGLKVASAKDDGATWAIAQSQRATVASLDAVKQSLARATSTVDVAMSAGQTVSDLLTQMKQKALAASDTSLDATSLSALNTDFQSLRDQITQVVSNADFNGANLLNGSVASVTPLANASGTSVITVGAQNLTLGGTIITIANTDSIGTTALAQTMVGTVDTCIQNVSAALAQLGTKSNALSMHSDFVSKLSDTLTTGIGNLVDADLAKESATLQALQTKQQLGVQALSIANQQPQSILALFK
jgi:flagellin